MNFTPSADVAAILNDLLDAFERRPPLSPVAHALRERREAKSKERQERGAGGVRRAIRCNLNALPHLAYHSQADPAPRQIANEQLTRLEEAGIVRLAWQPGETGHLLAAVTLIPEQADSVFNLLKRTPLATRRARLGEILLGDRFRFSDWRRQAIDAAIGQLREEKSPAPFSLADDDFNRDLLTALAALDEVREETPYRVFSVRLFNDSKRFDELMGAVTTLARRHQAEWRELSNAEILQELNLVANPGHLYLHGPWQLVDEDGQALLLGEFQPSVGIPAAQAARLKRASVSTPNVICVENPTSFYELIRGNRDPLSAICLWGNPSPACRHLLRCLPEETALFVWADIDYGGLNILAQLREQVNRDAQPYRMDIETLDSHSRWARPLSSADVANLTRLTRRPALADMRPLIAHLLQCGLKLEQEAIASAPEGHATVLPVPKSE
ncbi:MAG: DUF2399 domain-containing protein [Chloroflexi bacterium]|nr:DUF2399 domain-containing protein [Chloroflexota bacterium]